MPDRLEQEVGGSFRDDGYPERRLKVVTGWYRTPADSSRPDRGFRPVLNPRRRKEVP